jgi:hypothetical protein
VGSLFSGLAMMVLACFAPWMLFKLVHFIGGDVIAAHHQGMHHSVMAAGSTPVNMARSGASKVSGLVAGAGASAGSALGASAVSGVAPVGKSLVNNPVIKSVGGTGPADGGESNPGDGGPRPPQSGPPTPAGSPSPDSAPQQGGPPAGRPSPRPQPASLPAST